MSIRDSEINGINSAMQSKAIKKYVPTVRVGFALLREALLLGGLYGLSIMPINKD
ncbi:hypothetical protein N9Y42_08790 [Mariniblastus sp.]|nr:hypothetical protein [Mariniblastus sp.]